MPLDRWTADSGGRGIPLLIAIQARSQLVQGWGEAGAWTIWNNSNVKLVLGGLTDQADLEDLSKLCGERTQQATSRSVTSDGQRSKARSSEHVPVFTTSAIRTLPNMRALVLHCNARPVLVKITPVWERRDVRKAGRDG